MLAAGVTASRGRLDAAIAQLAIAERALEGEDLQLYATAARRQRGRLLGGTEGAALIAAADEAMRARTIVDPPRFADLLASGFANTVTR